VTAVHQHHAAARKIDRLTHSRPRAAF